MKKLILLFASLLIISVAFAQEKDDKQNESEYRTIFKSPANSVKVRGFGAVNIDFGYTNDNLRVLPGLDLAALFNRSFFVGIYGRIMGNAPYYTYTQYNIDMNKSLTVSQNTLFGHGGLLIGGVFFADKPIHFGISGRFGVGGVGLYDSYNHRRYEKPIYYDNYYPYSDPVFVFSPQADFEMNITNWFKFRLSAGYQYVGSSSVEYLGVENGIPVIKELFNTSEYSTPTVTLGLVFGFFN